MLHNNILSIITWLPAVGAIIILAAMKKDQSNLIKKFATAWFALDFLASLYLLKYSDTTKSSANQAVANFLIRLD